MRGFIGIGQEWLIISLADTGGMEDFHLFRGVLRSSRCCRETPAGLFDSPTLNQRIRKDPRRKASAEE